MPCLYPFYRKSWSTQTLVNCLNSNKRFDFIIYIFILFCLLFVFKINRLIWHSNLKFELMTKGRTSIDGNRVWNSCYTVLLNWTFPFPNPKEINFYELNKIRHFSNIVAGHIAWWSMSTLIFPKYIYLSTRVQKMGLSIELLHPLN